MTERTQDDEPADFAFGALSTDALRLHHYRLRGQGVRHAHDISPRRPGGGEPIILRATTGVDVNAGAVAVYYTTDGSEPRGERGAAGNGRAVRLAPVDVAWDGLAWGYVTHWEATLPGLPAGARLLYRIGAWSAGSEQPEIYADYPDLRVSDEDAANRTFRLGLPPDPSLRGGSPQPGTVFALTIGRPGAPAWTHDAVIYHLMIDRFYPGDGRDWWQTGDLGGFCGGTLGGVLDKLDYIAGLGANCVWLSPLCMSPSPHGYDVADYREVEPRYGDKETLRRLIDAAHERGLRVLFDLACNHVSSRHPIFQAALANSASSYRAWFTFDDSAMGYRCFFGEARMPEINLGRPDAREWMIENALYWVREFGIDGYRLDYAIGPRPDFWTYLVDACKREAPDSVYLGEVTDSPDSSRAYIGRLDGLLDFQANHALRQTFGWRCWTRTDFDAFMARHRRYHPPDFVMPAFIDNHDMDRLLFIARGDKSALLAALDALLCLPNPPVLLYGTEVGLSQRVASRQAGLEAVRGPMPWGAAQDAALLEQVRALIHARRVREAGL